jgi:hypothetical protein
VKIEHVIAEVLFRRAVRRMIRVGWSRDRAESILIGEYHAAEMRSKGR